jgi:hypothetical protein
MEKNNDDKEFFVATKDEIGDYLIYSSSAFALSEIDFINLIKICLIEARSKKIGRKFLDVYKDSTKYREDITRKRLNLIGVKDEDKSPTSRRNPNTR